MSKPERIDSEKPDTETSSPLITRRPHLGRLLTLLVFAILLGFYGLQLWYHASAPVPPLDEPFHILAG